MGLWKKRRRGGDRAGRGPGIGLLGGEIAEAQAAGASGRADVAALLFGQLVRTAEESLGHDDSTTLALRHQLAHWTGESGDPEGAVRMFERLLADRVTVQGADHADAALARHQLAHWHGRAGRHEEAARRYDEQYRAAEAAGQVETSLELLCNVGHWQQEGGDTASALRTYTRMLRTAEDALGRDHLLASIARQRYAALAGELPFGHERGHEGVEDLLTAAQEVERSGDPARAVRMYGRVAERSAQLYGAASTQTYQARKLQALAAVRAQEWAAAAEAFRHVLTCMEARGEGPGTSEYEQLAEQRQHLLRAARETSVRIGRGVGTRMASEVEAAPDTAFGVLSRADGDAHAAHLTAIRDRSGGPGPHEVTEQEWAEVSRRLSDQGQRPVALYFARPGRRPAPDDIALCERLGLAGVYVSRESAGTVHVEAYAVRDGGELAEASVVVEEDPQAEEPGTAQSGAGQGAGRRLAFRPGAEAIGDWFELKRARPSRTADDPASFGPYEVLETVGQGGFGRVHLCQDPDGILVAVKTLHARHAAVTRIRQGFAHEVQAALRVSGRFTVPVIAADTDAATPWLAVPYVAAPSLQELAERCGPLDEETVRVLGAGIASALTAIHAQGIVHLDLKPGNVLLTEDGPRVIDFGIAQITHLTEPRQGFTGTYAYASPEQLEGDAVFTPASDVFSLGTLLARLALGRSPWPGHDMMDVVRRIRFGTPDLDGLPDGLETVVRACLARRPADRPTPAEVAAALAPDVAAERIGPPRLPRDARDLIDEYATLPATRRLATLPYTQDAQAQTQAHATLPYTQAQSQAQAQSGTYDTVACTQDHPHGSQETTVAAAAGDRGAPTETATVPLDAPATDSTDAVTVADPNARTPAPPHSASGPNAHTPARPPSASGPNAHTPAPPPSGSGPGPSPAPDAAAELEVRVLRWEADAGGKPHGQVREECRAHADEAAAVLGAQHPLTLRLRVSQALLAVADGPDALADAEDVVARAARHLGEGHPTIRDARALLALLRRGAPG
ncbi:protein kinase [Streptomyces sp. NPDC014802]|uniref:protein kinase domain-containing protein n=1 Tax=Streptomyces sp. NPDC014802 TaxID=3364917 RepID=UPI003702AA0F